MKNLTCATKLSLLFGAGAIGLLLYHISALTAVYKRIDHDTVQSKA
jgi:hypothetical protein